MNWIKHPVVLEGPRLKLVPLEKAHFEGLVQAGKNPAVWEHFPFDGSDADRLKSALREAILKKAYGEQYPFTILEKSSEIIIGSTRFFEIFENHKKLEIGWSWMAPEYWGKDYNSECKFLLLSYCFETLKASRVQLKTRSSNLRSAAAIQKIGGKPEGILRSDRIMPDGSVRDTLLFSILISEWPKAKEILCNTVYRKTEN